MAMDIADILSAEATQTDVRAATKKACFQRAADMLARASGMRAAAIAAALAAREELGTTGFGNGCAIPHGRVAGLARMHAGVLRLAKPVDWEAIDSRPVDLLFVLIGPAEPGVEHLKALARISRMLRDRALVAKLRGAADGSALWALLAGPLLPARSAA